MPKEPLVSIIITTYKRENYLKEAIESAINQTYKNIEVLIIDDNDKDTAESNYVRALVTQIAKKDQRVFYYSMTTNRGACKARNYGAEMAKGEYINFLDDDDLLISNKIERQVEKYQSSSIKNVGMIGGFELIIDADGNITGERKNEISGNVFYENMCASICQTSVPLLRREIFMQAGGFGDIRSSQEHYMLARYFNVLPTYDYIQDYVVKIRHYPGIRISNGTGKVQGALELTEKMKKYYYKLTPKQKKKVEFCLRKNVIMAYLNCNDRKGAMEYYIKTYTGKLIPNLKIFVGIIFGIEGINKFVKVKKRIYR